MSPRIPNWLACPLPPNNSLFAIRERKCQATLKRHSLRWYSIRGSGLK